MSENEHRSLGNSPDGGEADEGIYVAYSATLRIFGDIKDFSKITKTLGFAPTAFCKRVKGEGQNHHPISMICGHMRFRLMNMQP